MQVEYLKFSFSFLFARPLIQFYVHAVSFYQNNKLLDSPAING